MYEFVYDDDALVATLAVLDALLEVAGMVSKFGVVTPWRLTLNPAAPTPRATAAAVAERAAIQPAQGQEGLTIKVVPGATEAAVPVVEGGIEGYV